MRGLKRVVGAALLFGMSSFLWGADVPETLVSSYKAFLEGRWNDALSGFRYIAALNIANPDPYANLALISRDTGNNDAALPLWVKASLFENVDGFIWNQRGWSYISADRLKDAGESFRKAIDRSSTTASQAEANLGLGIASLLDSRPKAGMAPLRSALVQGPYIMPIASYETALTALAMKDKGAAQAYLRQSAGLDPMNLETLSTLANLYDKIGETRAAWRVYHQIASLNPADENAAAQIKKLTPYIHGDPLNSLPIRRLARPLLSADSEQNATLSHSSVSVRVALYSREDGKPATAKSLFFMANSDFKLTAGNGEVIKDDGKGLDQWEILFRGESNLVEVRDTAHNIQHTAKQPFRITPTARGGSVLVKSVQFDDTVGLDPGDREMRGTLEIVPTPYGFKLINEVPLEDYLMGAVGAAMPQGSPQEAYKAQAVLARTIALYSKATHAPNLERYDLCDSAACQRYLGVNDEMAEANKGVAATEGMVLSLDGRLAKVMQHENCGGVTEDGGAVDESLKALVSVKDAPGPIAPLGSPLELERWAHEFPPRDRFCEAGGLTPAVQSRWIRILEARDLKARAEKIKYIGSIKSIHAKKRTATGRIRVLEVEGSKDSLVFEGDKAISDFLSPGSLRSTLFTITPLMKGDSAERFILWGVGTGSGLGMCRAGAIGQASMGRDFKTILATYFPNLKLDSIIEKPKPAAAPASAPASGKRKRHLNPRKKPVQP